MTDLMDKKINELERTYFTTRVITLISRFLTKTNQTEISERWLYITQMYDSLEKYNVLYQTTGNNEYKNILENNYASCLDSLEEQKNELHHLFSLSSLLFLENIKKHFRNGFLEELSRITNQFSDSKDVAEYISYHGSLDLNKMIDYVLNKNTTSNYLKLFEQIKEKRIIKYKRDEWLGIGSRLNSCLLEIFVKEQENDELLNYIYKLTAYRFLLTVFDYDI